MAGAEGKRFWEGVYGEVGKGVRAKHSRFASASDNKYSIATITVWRYAMHFTDSNWNFICAVKAERDGERGVS